MFVDRFEPYNVHNNVLYNPQPKVSVACPFLFNKLLCWSSTQQLAFLQGGLS